jgi:hypothetical protein
MKAVRIAGLRGIYLGNQGTSRVGKGTLTKRNRAAGYVFSRADRTPGSRAK